MKTLSITLASAALALAVAPASAVILSLEDDDLDFHLRYDAVNDELVAASDTQILPGDVLLGVVEFPSTNIPGLVTDDRELTGITVFERTDDGQNPIAFEFSPYSRGMNAVLAQFAPGISVGTPGDAGEGALIAMWLDNSPDLDIASSLVPTPGGFSCSTLAECVVQATDGTLFEVDGFTGDLVGGIRQPAFNEYWTALSVTANPQVILNGSTATTYGFFNAAMSVLDPAASGATGAPILTNLNGDGVAVLLTGSLLGGGPVSSWGNTAQRATLVADGFTATSDATLNKEIPAPATLALLGAGLLGFQASRRRHRA
jgi:hypothetical protein